MPKIIYYTRQYVNRLSIEASRIDDHKLRVNMLLELREIQKMATEGTVKICDQLPEKNKISTISVENIKTGEVVNFTKLTKAGIFIGASVYMVERCAQLGKSINGYYIQIKK